jgi:hypothetical protein
MVKESKFLRKQARKAEKRAEVVEDAEAAENMRRLASAYRAQAEVIRKAEKPKGKH